MSKIYSLIGLDKDPLAEYNFFKIRFNICKYIFIVPAELSILFGCFYCNIINNSLLFFQIDFKEAKELLNAYKIGGDNKDNWLIIAPCIELEKNIKISTKI